MYSYVRLSIPIDVHYVRLSRSMYRLVPLSIPIDVH